MADSQEAHKGQGHRSHGCMGARRAKGEKSGCRRSMDRGVNEHELAQKDGARGRRGA
ncbi:hypothetical protein BDN71DRAFT_1441683 [Pleurotus eryngii]|uniref:Uncharacterized protein n=1 Tax=Pleurotus eryngii TaxID=5323 RepID=A0A9P6DCC5_PLEER|nr:hypothetical protein BDN71DRAFT_1441683 [Pleurotus eryngii]